MSTSTTADPPRTAEGETPQMPTFNWYGPDDLVTRRKALGITGRDLAVLVGRTQGNLSDAERGTRKVSDQLIDMIREIETWAAKHYSTVLATARDYADTHRGEPIPLRRLTQAAFTHRYPAARTEHGPFPVSLHETVVGRVASTLELEGYTVTVSGASK